MSDCLAQFQDINGAQTGPTLCLPVETTAVELEILINKLLNNEDHLPYSFFYENLEIKTSVRQDVLNNSKSTEQTIVIVYKPQAVFRVRPVTRCGAALPGHLEAVLTSQFSPDGKIIATGSGDSTVRLWDVATTTPIDTLRQHTSWVLCVSFSPCNRYLASGAMNGVICIYDQKTSFILKGHRNAITTLSWEPLHQNANPRLCSSSRDCTLRVWELSRKQTQFTISQHTKSVTCVKWGGEGFIYSASQDCSIKVWSDVDGSLVKTLSGHAHWVNSLALSSEFVLRTGPYSHDYVAEDKQKAAEKRYRSLHGDERLVSASDDFTLMLWVPKTDKKPKERMVGHQAAVNHVVFSPSGSLIASASFDKSVKIWDGFTGAFLFALRSHVSAVYQCVFSSDERLLLTGSQDSTCKIFDLRTQKLKVDLPGHADQVYTVDWSTQGSAAVSGSKDCTVRIWKP